jgi:hypothetical protein
LKAVGAPNNGPRGIDIQKFKNNSSFIFNLILLPMTWRVYCPFCLKFIDEKRITNIE